MSLDQELLATLAAKDEIRELALLYSRGVDRMDEALLRTLYARDGVDNHGELFRGSADDFVSWLAGRWRARNFSRDFYSGHHVCNHLISVSGDEGEGEVYTIAWHTRVDAAGAFSEDISLVRYLDQYRKEDGRWRFAQRDVSFDFNTHRPFGEGDELAPYGNEEQSYMVLKRRLFARGARA
jgi:hypothetical protein